MSYAFKPIKKATTLSQEIQDRIEKAILDRQFLPGEKLPTEHELCEMFGVSRTALREALQMLGAKGLISVKKGSGIYIEDYSPQNVIQPMRLYLELNFDKSYILQLIEVRKIIEPQICKMAARNRSEEDIRKRTRHILEECWEGGGYIFGSGNSLANYVPLDNYLYMLDEGRRFGR